MKRKDNPKSSEKITATEATTTTTAAAATSSLIQTSDSKGYRTRKVPTTLTHGGDDNGEQRNRKLLKKQKRKQRKKERKKVKTNSKTDPKDSNDDDNISEEEAVAPEPKRRKLDEGQSPPKNSNPSKSASDRALNQNEDKIVSDSREDDDDDEEEDDDDDDDMLLAAAEQWATSDDTPADNDGTNNVRCSQIDDNEDEHVSNSLLLDGTMSSTVPQQSFSLHVTQLPYDASELDLRRLFVEHGCSVISIRLVYDRDTRGQKTVFRGVAFVDMSNQQSYEAALKLNHKASIRGRKLNIRPTRSKEELANIVVRTRELVQEKIRQQRTTETSQENGTGTAGADGASQPRNHESDSKRSPRGTKGDKKKDKKKDNKGDEERKERTKDSKKDKKKNSSTKKVKSTDGNERGNGGKDGVGQNEKGRGGKDVVHDKGAVKLSKKERNRRAAIILRLKNKGGRQQKK